MSNRSKCKNCDAWISWGTMYGGKKWPFDQVADHFVLLDMGGDGLTAQPVYTPHFKTCPAAKRKDDGGFEKKPKGVDRDDIQF